MHVSDAEAEKFWPVYQHYTNDLKQINDEKYALLKNYAQSWGDMSNQDALIYIRRWLEVIKRCRNFVPSMCPWSARS